MRDTRIGAAVVAALGLCVLAAAPAVPAAQPCLNEARRAEDPYSTALPDCRAYEQVSPVQKYGTDANGSSESVRVAPSGEAVTFVSLAAFPGSEGEAGLYSAYVAMRGAQGWSARNMQSFSSPASAGLFPLGVSEDLEQLLAYSLNEPPLSPEGAEGVPGVYLRDTTTGAYRLLVSGARLTEEFYLVAAADDDSRILFESPNRLLEQAPPEEEGRFNLYEWHEGSLSLVDVLPKDEGGEVPKRGAWAGPYGVPETRLGGSAGGLLVKGAVSEDGARVFFTDAKTGYLYVREPQADPPVTIKVSEGKEPAVWRAATADGSQVFYTEGGALYRCDVDSETREALTGMSAHVLGVMGIGDDGAYVYFAAEGVLAQGATAGVGNLYLYHEGKVSFIAEESDRKIAEETETERLTTEAVWTAGDDKGVSGAAAGPADSQRSASVSADGETLVFTSPASLTGYENAGHVEVYLYSASSNRLTCVSCNPRHQPASDDAFVYLPAYESVAEPPNLSPAGEPRFLSEDGSRVFFETPEALLAQDENGQVNVYEWEREGVGGCPVGRSEGCLYSISTGTSGEPSLFAGASASGDDVFFFTRQQLVGQDDDYLVDLYDARVDGGLAAQNPSAALAACQGEACRPAQTSAPGLGAPVSQVFSGPGNLEPPVGESKPAGKLKAKARPLTRAQKLQRALRACASKPRHKRGACQKRARKRYGVKRARKPYGGASVTAKSGRRGR